MNRSLLSMLVLLVMTATVLVIAQPPAVQPKGDDEVPAAALLTERGTQLATRLKWLRNAESNLGKKHPSLADIRKQIADIKEELKAWQPGTNPFSSDSASGIARQIPTMNDEDLRQLVLRLTNEVTELKTRVEKLEQRR